jgi:hypothetical protein
LQDAMKDREAKVCDAAAEALARIQSDPVAEP